MKNQLFDNFSKVELWVSAFKSRIANCKSLKDLTALEKTLKNKSLFFNVFFQQLLSFKREGNNEVLIFIKALTKAKKHFFKLLNNKRTDFYQQPNKIKNFYDQQFFQKFFLEEINFSRGKLSLFSQFFQTIRQFFANLNFLEVDGKEITDEKLNFYQLGFEKTHPAFNVKDTFYFKRNNFLLRTHCTSVTYSYLKELLKETTTLGDKNENHLGIFTIGNVYRRDTDDNTHNHQFSQLDVVVTGEQINLENLFWFINKFLLDVLQISQERIFWRRSYFPFTSPSFEVDIICDCLNGCFFCSWSKKIEILGAGMISEKIILSHNKKTIKKGFACGIGIDRLLMIKYKIPDIRYFFENNFYFLNSF